MEVGKEVGGMAGQNLRVTTRIAFVIGGVALVGVAVLLALQHTSEMTSFAAMVAGALLVVLGGSGRLPEEIGLQRVAFSKAAPDDEARDYREALYDAVREALPELEPPRRDADWHPEQPTYWVDEMQLRIVVTWAPDESWRIGVSMVEPAVEQAGPDTGVLLVTNVDEIDDLQTALRASLGERGAVVRWRSPADNELLKRTARKLHLPRRPDNGGTTNRRRGLRRGHKRTGKPPRGR
jgi:hypothetical protein